MIRSSPLSERSSAHLRLTGKCKDPAPITPPWDTMDVNHDNRFVSSGRYVAMQDAQSN